MTPLSRSVSRPVRGHLGASGTLPDARYPFKLKGPPPWNRSAPPFLPEPQGDPGVTRYY